MRFAAAVVGLTLLFAPVARGQNHHLLAVLPLDAGSARLDRAARELLEETLRTIAGDALRPYGYTVLTNDNTLTVLKDNGVDPEKVCQASCALQAARELKAEVFISGKITTLEGSVVAIIRLTEPRAGQQLASLQLEAANVRQLRALLAQRTPELLLPLHRGAGSKRKTAAAEEGPITVEQGAQPDSDSQDGIVDFESTPSGPTVVRVDNELVCQKTPCRKTIPLGLHVVTMERERYLAVTQSMTLKADSTVHLALQPTFGTLSVDTSPPGLSVAINGKVLGTSPIKDAELDPDVYPVVIQDDCYLPEGQRILIKRAEHRDIQIAATARLVTLKVDAVDATGNSFHGAVSVDGREVGETPGTFKVPVCSESVTVRQADGHSWKNSLKLQEGKVETITADFSRAALLAQAAAVVEKRRRIPAWAWIVGGIGTATWAGAGLGAIEVHTGLMAATPGDPSIQGTMNTGNALLVVSNIGAAAVLAAAIGAIVGLAVPQ